MTSKTLVKEGTRVRVHKNLTRGTYAIATYGTRSSGSKGWIVREYRDTLTLSSALPICSVKGSERIRRKSKENGAPAREVVARIEGVLEADTHPRLGREIHYNPFRRDDFHTLGGDSYTGSRVAYFPTQAGFFIAQGGVE